MGSRTNPNTCAKCESPLTAMYTYARGCVEPYVHWSCPLCDATPTSPAPAVRHWQHDETGRVCDCVDCPGPRYHEVNEAFAEAHEKAMREKCGTPAPADDASGAEAMRAGFEAWWDGPKDGETMRPFGSGSKAHAWMVWQAARALPLPPATGDATRVHARDDARPMVTGGGLIKFDRRADDARRIVPPCPGCVSERGVVDPTCRYCGGTGRCPSADDAGVKQIVVTTETTPDGRTYTPADDASGAEALDDEAASIEQRVLALDKARPGYATRLARGILGKRDASGAEAMREACAKVLDAEVLRLKAQVAAGETERMTEALWTRALAVEKLAAAIRALPLPATDDAVEEAARAIVDDLDADGTHVVRHAHLEALRAALRREKGGAM